jgi:hypothetical protein
MPRVRREPHVDRPRAMSCRPHAVRAVPSAHAPGRRFTLDGVLTVVLMAGVAFVGAALIDVGTLGLLAG